jgi:hypothetical protein
MASARFTAACKSGAKVLEPVVVATEGMLVLMGTPQKNKNWAVLS